MRSILLLATVCAVAAPAVSLAQRGDTTFTWSNRMAAGATLAIRSPNGPIDVRASGSDRVEVRATKRVMSSRRDVDPRDLTFDVRERGGDVSICVVYRGENSCEDNARFNNVRMQVRFVVDIPKTVRLVLSTGNGEIDIAHAGAEVRAATGNGRVTVGETEGSVTVSTGNGDVEVESAKGPVKVSTGNGRVLVRTSVGPVNASTGNGDIDVRMRTLSAQNDMTFSTGSGSVRLTVPSDFRGEIDAGTGNGSLDSDFDIRISGRLDPRHVRGSIGSGGGPVIRMRTGNGRLELRKG